MSPAKVTKAKATKKAAAKPAAKRPVAKPAPKAKPVAKAKPAAKPVAKAAAKPAPKAPAKPESKPMFRASVASGATPSKSAGNAPMRAFVARPRQETVKAKPLTKTQIEHFRLKLLAEKQRVAEEMGELTSGTFMKSITDESGENSRYSYHLGDVASLSYGREFSMGLAERQQNYLEQIDEALQRIADGVYGICKVTGEPISMERLEEVPVAKYSVRGKEILEQQKRHGGGTQLQDERKSNFDYDDQGGDTGGGDE